MDNKVKFPKTRRFWFPEMAVWEIIKKYGFYRTLVSDTPIFSSQANRPASSGRSMPTSKRPIKYKYADNDKIENLENDIEKINLRFEEIEESLKKTFVGQKNYLPKLCLAFKRDLITKYNIGRPRNTIFITGGKSTGKHSTLKEITRLMSTYRLIKTSAISYMDLSDYNNINDRDIFIEDINEELKSRSQVILFDNFDKAHLSVIDIVSNLIIYGNYKVKKRESNILENFTNVENISELNASGRYFVFITDRSEKKIFDTFDSKVTSKITDILRTDDFSNEEISLITKKHLLGIADRCLNNFNIELVIYNSAISLCVDKYSFTTGIDGLKNYCTENVYKPIANYILNNSKKDTQKIKIFSDCGKIVSEIDGIVYPLEDFIEKTAATDLEEVKKEIAEVIGLEKVKEYLEDLERNFEVQRIRQEAGKKVANISKHMIFTGNPGTGKTTMARLIAKYFKALGLLSGGQLREVTRADLVGQYVGHTAVLTNEVIKSALGGVLFVDEAYALCRDKNDVFGLEAVDALVKAIEDNRDDLVVILAGYTKEMADFLEVNSGLKSRFPNIIEFEDYTASELLEISKKMAKVMGYEIEKDCFDPLLKLYEKSQIKGRNDSGNARLARNIIEDAVLKQSKRILKNDQEEVDILTYADFNFVDYGKFDLEEKLEKIIGLENVKKVIRTQQQLILANEKRKNAGIEVNTKQTMNMIFTGNPGTGKTTIARVMAEMFKDMGMLKSGHLVEVDKSGLVGEYIGHTAKKTEEVFRKALGGVLFIDEAYALAGSSGNTNSFEKEAIDTLVKLIEDYRDDIVVVLAGYKKEMAEFIKTNSGLMSRFPMTIDFPDYTVEELYRIALKMISAKGFIIEEIAKKKLYECVFNMHKYSTVNSGNARMIRNFVEDVMRNQSERIATSEVLNDELNVIVESDFIKEKVVSKNFNLEQELSKVIGIENVKQYIRSLSARLKIQKEREKLGIRVSGIQSLHMIFMGNPGTGKTMMARMVANLFYSMGVIKTNNLVETDRAGLVAGYVGQTAIKTTEKVMEAMDGVLFIDEAYSLTGMGNDFGKEAIDTLVKLMDDYRERLVVILAGYSKEMASFLAMNSGLKSRFPNIIEFSDYSTDELLKIAEMFYDKQGYCLSETAKDKLASLLDAVNKNHQFGNGRYVRNIVEKSINQQSLRLVQDFDLTKEELITIEQEDITDGL